MTARRQPTNRTARRRGATAVEFVIVLPLLLLFCLAAVDLGRFAATAIAVQHAARVGAEAGATRQFTDYTYASWEDRVRDAAREDLAELSAAQLAAAEIEVAVDDPDEDLARLVVRVEAPFWTVIDWWGLSSTLHVRREASIRQYR